MFVPTIRWIINVSVVALDISDTAKRITSHFEVLNSLGLG